MIAGLGLLTLAAIAVAAFAAAILHGSTGMAGGVVMAAILAHLIGVKAAVPAMTVALVFSHLTRALMYARETDWDIARRVLLFGCPMIVIGALIFGRISATAVAGIFAAVLALSFPVKTWAQRRNARTSPAVLAVASMIWGVLAGNVIGPGFFLAPFLLGTGMNRMTFVGTLASVTLVMNLLKTAVFGTTGVMSQDVFWLGVGIGLISLPGNWIGREILRSVRDKDHRLAVDILTVLMIANFVYLAFTA